MTFAKMTIAQAVDGIRTNAYVLPAIQREFTWNQHQIVSLFDSLLRHYPIGSFLFWKLNPDDCNSFRFYEFLREYHEKRSRHNPPIDLTGSEGATAVLDGQQRLTSLYIGLLGTYAEKLPNRWWKFDENFPERKAVPQPDNTLRGRHRRGAQVRLPSAHAAAGGRPP